MKFKPTHIDSTHRAGYSQVHEAVWESEAGCYRIIARGESIELSELAGGGVWWHASDFDIRVSNPSLIPFVVQGMMKALEEIPDDPRTKTGVLRFKQAVRSYLDRLCRDPERVHVQERKVVGSAEKWLLAALPMDVGSKTFYSINISDVEAYLKDGKR